MELLVPLKNPIERKTNFWEKSVSTYINIGFIFWKKQFQEYFFKIFNYIVILIVLQSCFFKSFLANLTGDGSSAPVSPLDPTLIAGDGVEVEKSPKPVQVAVTSNLDLCDDSLSDICKEPPK